MMKDMNDQNEQMHLLKAQLQFKCILDAPIFQMQEK